MERFAAIDFETANGKRSSVCSVGIVIVENNEIVDTFQSLICPRPNFYTSFTMAVHGLGPQDTNEAPDFEEVWAKVSGKLKDIPLIAHNSVFDEGCLKAAHAAYDLAYPRYEFYCTCRISRRMYPFLVNHRLPTVSKYCGFDLMNHHDALADAEACAEIAIHMLREKNVQRLADLI